MVCQKVNIHGNRNLEPIFVTLLQKFTLGILLQYNSQPDILQLRTDTATCYKKKKDFKLLKQLTSTFNETYLIIVLV